MKTPPELIPAPEMTAKQMMAWAIMANQHPQVLKLVVTWKPSDLIPGYHITTVWEKWDESFETVIIEDFDWDAFEDLRIKWEQDVTIAA